MERRQRKPLSKPIERRRPQQQVLLQAAEAPVVEQDELTMLELDEDELEEIEPSRAVPLPDFEDALSGKFSATAHDEVDKRFPFAAKFPMFARFARVARSNIELSLPAPPTAARLLFPVAPAVVPATTSTLPA